MKILVIDDSSYVRTQLKWILGKAGYETVWEGDYKKVLEKYENTHPYAVLFTILSDNSQSLASLISLKKKYMFLVPLGRKRIKRTFL